MMLNRDRDRERGLPVGFSRQIIGMVLIPIFLLVSFGFEGLPLPVPYSFLESRHPGFLFPYAASPFYKNSYKISSRLYKTEWKARVEAQTKGERKSRKGGRSLVLVLTETSLSNFHFWVVSLFYYLDWKKDPSTNCVLFCQRDFFRPLHKKYINIKNINKGAYAGRGPHYFFIQGGGRLASLLPTGREVHLTHLPTHQSWCSADLHR